MHSARVLLPWNINSLIKKLDRNHSKNSYKRLAKVEKEKTIKVQKGHLALYVGKEGKRYEVPVKYLAIPTFQELIIQSHSKEIDIKIDGPIVLACSTEIFDQELKLAKEHYY